MKTYQFISEAIRGGPGLDGYAYQADVYCETCGEEIIRSIADKVAPTVDEVSETTSEECPQPIFFGESDSPQHCAECGEFLYGPARPSTFRFPGAERRRRCSRDLSETLRILAVLARDAYHAEVDPRLLHGPQSDATCAYAQSWALKARFAEIVQAIEQVADYARLPEQ